MNNIPLWKRLPDCNIPPWRVFPYSLLTWWEMEQFSAAVFYDFGSRLGGARKNLESGSEKTISKADWQKTSGYKTLKRVRAQCEAIGLTISVLSVDKFLKGVHGNLSTKRLSQALSEIENTIHSEMSVEQFFYMPRKQSDFYDQPELFGKKVDARFPKIQFDMIEAGNCFAMGRGTACVFHLMRIMETGVQEFGTALGVALTGQKNWHNILGEINKAIDLLPKNPKKVEMSQVSANLYSVKLAWRNEVMHPNDKYTLEEAKNLLGQVSLFMKQLAEII
jgi:hypothetical protein